MSTRRTSAPRVWRSRVRRAISLSLLIPASYPTACYNAVMPFTNCRQCGRLFHTFEPLMPESSDVLGPNMLLGDAVLELCPECLKRTRNHRHDADPTSPAAAPQSSAFGSADDPMTNTE